MARINKHPQVIRDLIDLATYISEDNLDASDKFLVAAEETFRQLGKMPGMGKPCNFDNPNLKGIRQQAIKGFKKYLIFYRASDLDVDIIRVIHSARDIEAILEDDS
ncbi:type II toxin-antitoxin system RelE/ParE family toxin [Calothrix sp. UHCC 0171]|uniref:type II toxin-antitoxin system RelE/ParE family toxin n=1 Tax=Calothrix sp. UHCC 0171 TaxID=3110245 RepID=UPI002B21C970|nr:type II toxin-antitoxin system RelE/ParE family toxin [Calothrix sp. UHCC 0171]MEA5571559.1 type II toxin-antitoxin system RelE/ParE family toxin [Calothrix sp. UHCC 0171]